MISIIKNGKDKKYFIKCYKCASELEYEHSDVVYEHSHRTGSDETTIVCPVCGTTLIVRMLTKEEIDKGGSSLGFGYTCCG